MRWIVICGIFLFLCVTSMPVHGQNKDNLKDMIPKDVWEKLSPNVQKTILSLNSQPETMQNVIANLPKEWMPEFIMVYMDSETRLWYGTDSKSDCLWVYLPLKKKQWLKTRQENFVECLKQHSEKAQELWNRIQEVEKIVKAANQQKMEIESRLRDMKMAIGDMYDDMDDFRKDRYMYFAHEYENLVEICQRYNQKYEKYCPPIDTTFLDKICDEYSVRLEKMLEMARHHLYRIKEELEHDPSNYQRLERELENRFRAAREMYEYIRRMERYGNKARFTSDRLSSQTEQYLMQIEKIRYEMKERYGNQEQMLFYEKFLKCSGKKDQIVFIESSSKRYLYNFTPDAIYPYIRQIPLESLEYLKPGKSPQLEQIFVKMQDPDRPLRWWGVSQGKTYWYKNNSWKSLREMIPDEVWNKLSQDAKNTILQMSQDAKNTVLQMDFMSGRIQNLACNLPEYWLSDFSDVSIDVYAESPLWYCKIDLYRWVYLPSKKMWITIYTNDFLEFLNAKKKDDPREDQIFRASGSGYKFNREVLWNYQTKQYIHLWQASPITNTVEFVHTDVLEQYCEWLIAQIPQAETNWRRLKATIVTQETAKTPEIFENKLRNAMDLDGFLATRQEFLAEMTQNSNKDWSKAKDAADQKYSGMVSKFFKIMGEDIPDIQNQKKSKIDLMQRVGKYLSEEERSAIKMLIDSNYNKAEDEILKKNWGLECQRLELLLTDLENPEKRDTFKTNWNNLLRQKFYTDEQYRNQRISDYKEEAGRLWQRIQSIQSAIQNAEEKKSNIEARAKQIVEKIAFLPKVISEQEYTDIAKQYQDLPRDCELYNQNYGYYQQVTIADCQSRSAAFQQNWKLASTKFEAIQNKKLETRYDYETLQEWMQQYKSLALQAQEHTTVIEAIRKAAEEWYGNISKKSDDLKNRYTQWKEKAINMSCPRGQRTIEDIDNTKAEFAKLQEEWKELSQAIPDNVKKYNPDIVDLQAQCEKLMSPLNNGYDSWMKLLEKEDSVYAEIKNLYGYILDAVMTKQFDTMASSKAGFDARVGEYGKLEVRITEKAQEINEWKATLGGYYAIAHASFRLLKSNVDALPTSVTSSVYGELSQQRVEQIPGEFQSLKQRAQIADSRCKAYLDNYGYCNVSEVKELQKKIVEAFDKIGQQEKSWTKWRQKVNDARDEIKNLHQTIQTALKNKETGNMEPIKSFYSKIAAYAKLPLRITEHNLEIASLHRSLLQKANDVAQKMYARKQRQALSEFVACFSPSSLNKQFQDYAEYGVWKSETSWYVEVTDDKAILDILGIYQKSTWNPAGKSYKLNIKLEAENGWVLEPITIGLFLRFLNESKGLFDKTERHFSCMPSTFFWNNKEYKPSANVSAESPVIMVSPAGADKLCQWLQEKRSGKGRLYFPEKEVAKFTFTEKGRSLLYFIRKGDRMKVSDDMEQPISQEYMQDNIGIVFFLFR